MKQLSRYWGNVYDLNVGYNAVPEFWDSTNNGIGK